MKQFWYEYPGDVYGFLASENVYAHVNAEDICYLRHVGSQEVEVSHDNRLLNDVFQFGKGVTAKEYELD